MKLLIFLLFIVFYISGFSQKTIYTKITDTKKLELLINNNSAKINTIKSDFIQEKRIEYLNETIISKGKFWFKKENNLRWEYLDPFKYVIVIRLDKFSIIDGRNISVYDITTNPAFKEINDIIISMAKGNMIKDNKFNIEAFENSNSYFLKLIPKNEAMKKFIMTTEVYIDKSDLSVIKVIMKESETDFTTITFLNRKINEEIQNNIFIAK